MATLFNDRKVLVVDPNRHMRSLVRGVLHAFGIKDIHEASDAAEAFKDWKTFPADIIVTELEMSPLGGLDFVRLIRTAKDSPDPHVPVIVLTAYTETKNVAAARDAGMTEFLSKPISAQSLYARIHAVLVRPRGFVHGKKFFGPDRRRRAVGSWSKEERRS